MLCIQLLRVKKGAVEQLTIYLKQKLYCLTLIPGLSQNTFVVQDLNNLLDEEF